MGRIVVGNLLIPLYIFYTLITGPTLSFRNKIDSKILKVGEELWKETLPQQMGSRLYQIQRLKPHTWYDVKISYLASIPASFSLQLRRGNLNSALRVNRRLLNTKKLIFKAENIDISNQCELHDLGIYYSVISSCEPESYAFCVYISYMGLLCIFCFYVSLTPIFLRTFCACSSLA
ncbi:hypothetical protein UlMin_009372 [Ulmus minor]